MSGSSCFSHGPAATITVLSLDGVAIGFDAHPSRKRRDATHRHAGGRPLRLCRRAQASPRSRARPQRSRLRAAPRRQNRDGIRNAGKRRMSSAAPSTSCGSACCRDAKSVPATTAPSGGPISAMPVTCSSGRPLRPQSRATARRFGATAGHRTDARNNRAGSCGSRRATSRGRAVARIDRCRATRMPRRASSRSAALPIAPSPITITSYLAIVADLPGRPRPKVF